MSIKYKHPKDVPIEILISRLNELSNIITGENPKQNMEREFTMRIPAEYDRDPDLVMAIAAARMKDITKENEHQAEVINKRDGTIKQLQRRIRTLESGVKVVEHPNDCGCYYCTPII